MPSWGQIPPFTVQRKYLANELTDRLDWGQEGMPEAWKHAKGDGVIVAVLDTGADQYHVTRGDLNGAVKAGRNFTPFGGPDDYWDSRQDGHGSHCCGIVGAREDHGPIIGYAPNCSLLVGKCLHRGAGDFTWIANAVKWSVDMGANVISMSLGGPYPDDNLLREIERAHAAGAFVIAAAGNDGADNSVGYPARYPYPLAIGAVDRHGNPAPYSSRGPQVDFVGPGTDVTSLWLDGGHATVSGTSMATPALAGVTACLIDVHRRLPGGGKTPLKTREQLVEHLKRHVRDIGDAGKDFTTGWGLPDFSKIGEEAETDEPGDPFARFRGLLGRLEFHAPPSRDGDVICVGIRK